MPSRNPGVLCGSVLNLSSLLQALPTTKHPEAYTKCRSCLFSTTSIQLSKQGGRKRPTARKDPYRVAQAAQRKSANLEKRRVLAEERKVAMGDPIRSKPTPFLASLDLAKENLPTEKEYLNYQLDPENTSQQLSRSQWLTEPLPRMTNFSNQHEKDEHAKRLKEHKKDHENAVRAIETVTSLQNANQKDKTRINVQRCVETFGRHNTDSRLPPKPASLGPTHAAAKLGEDVAPTPEETRRAELLAELEAVPKRAGPDTGSSEVQIAILTTKINVLAQNLHNKDKTNKRNLRLLVHRRQKLLNYLRKKERGGPRWQHIVDQLGISDGMWKGEITL